MVMNVGLLVIGFFLIGPEFGAKTVYCAVLLPACIGCLPVGAWLRRRLPAHAAVKYLCVAADIALFALCVFMLLGSTYNPFIYFRF